MGECQEYRGGATQIFQKKVAKLFCSDNSDPGVFHCWQSPLLVEKHLQKFINCFKELWYCGPPGWLQIRNMKTINGSFFLL